MNEYSPLLPSKYVEEDHNSYFHPESIPNDIWTSIWSFLPINQVGRMALVCKHFKKVSYNSPLLWKHMYKKQPARDMYEKRVLSESSDYRTYFIRLHKSKEALKQEQHLQSWLANQVMASEKIHEEQIPVPKFTWRQLEVLGILLLISGWSLLYEWIVYFALIWVTITASLKLDGAIDWKWHNILIPVYFALIPLNLNPLTLCIARRRGLEAALEKYHYRGKFLQSRILFEFSTIPSGVTCFCIGTWLLLLCVELATQKIPWIVVFIPLLVLCLLGILFNVFRNEIWKLPIFLKIPAVLLFGLLLAFFVLLPIRLDNYLESSWQLIFVPLYIIEAPLFLFGLCLPFVVVLFRGAVEGLPVAYFVSICIILVALILTPLLTFEILIAQKLDGERHSSYMAISSPLLIVEIELVIYLLYYFQFT